VIALGVLYRVRQFTLALGAQVYLEGTEDLSQYLNRRQLDLFHSMSSADRHHCAAVWRTLQEDGYNDPSLLTAALLHDVGKTLGPVRIWHRVVAVLARALVPATWESIDAKPGTWLFPLYVHRHHATLGSQLAAQAGCREDAVWLIAHHEDAESTSVAGDRRGELLAALMAADQVN
jgi:hypothetical protein